MWSILSPIWSAIAYCKCKKLLHLFGANLFLCPSIYQYDIMWIIRASLSEHHISAVSVCAVLSVRLLPVRRIADYAKWTSASVMQFHKSNFFNVFSVINSHVRTAWTVLLAISSCLGSRDC